ncbi:MAG: DEAD/DEAH box helicase family protein [Gammaproteobacteria bacterium]
MFAISSLIARRAADWASGEKQNTQSAPGAILRHIERAGALRKPQADAIETYLWLKFCGNNRRLADLVIAGELRDRELAREHSCDDETHYTPLQQFLIIFARENGLNGLETSVHRDLSMESFEWESDLRKLLHDFAYPNYLYSLPMGAGKTYLMAAFIAIDLHFSRLLPDDARFAHNFIVFAPHSAKTAILPSLKTIRAFDPNWVLPLAAAAEVRREMRVEILDAAKSAKDSIRVNNPNLEKVNRLSQTRKRGLVFITNAEKVVLEQPAEHEKMYAGLGMKNHAEREKTNELRERMAEISNLAVFLDEVHHAYQGSGTREKKLRAAVGVLGRHGNLRGVIGFSGTPFVATRAEVGGNSLRLKQLQDVVYDYPLARGIGAFLKTPKVVRHKGVREATFVHAALDDFFKGYDRQYADGTQSKIAFYCPNIAALNEDILPAVQGWYAKNRARKENEIFSYYTGDRGAKNKSACKKYPLPKTALAEFHNLDTSHNGRRVVLLVAVGKEGWDCRSLTAVALPRRETTATFVLQAACRCLREMRNAAEENALVYLGDGNYEIFAEQLRKNHDMSVDEFENSDYSRSAPVVVCKPKLGALRYTQVDSKIVIESAEEKSDVAGELAAFLRRGFAKFKNDHRHYEHKTTGRITKSGALAEKVVSGAAPADDSGDFPLASYWDFLVDLSQALWGGIPAAELSERHGGALEKIHAAVANDEQWFRRHPHGMAEMCRIALCALAACFGVVRHYCRETITEKVKIELLEWDSGEARIPWGSGLFLPEIKRTDLPRLHRRTNRLQEDLDDSGIDDGGISFNYVPYRFGSNFERIAIREMLKQDFFREFELYYNGMTAAGLESFQIRTPAGGYTPDFLLLKREGGRRYQTPPAKPAKIEKVLIIETKGKPYYDEAFKARKRFVLGEFRDHNPNFRYFCAVDEPDKNDFASHIERLRREVGEWARA